MFFTVNRVKKRTDIIGAFKMEPLYLKHENQESGRVFFWTKIISIGFYSQAHTSNTLF